MRKALAPKPQKIEKPALPAPQVEQRFAALNRPERIRHKAAFMVLALTGIRCGECLGLKWANISFPDSALHIKCSIYKGGETTPKMQGSLRDRPMMPELRQALLNHPMSVYVKPTDYVFSVPTGHH